MLKGISSRRRLVVTLCFILRLFSFMPVSQQDRVFIYVPYSVKQWEARRYCREHHTDLATFQNAGELNALQAPCRTDSYCWIGLQRVPRGSDTMVWSDGEAKGFTHWDTGEPNHLDENCVGMQNSVWFDTECHNEEPFLCYEDEPILVQNNKTWEEALDDCRALYQSPFSNPNYFKHVYDLYQIRSGNFTSITQGVIAEAQTQEVWIGLRFLAGEWLWLNDNPLQIQLPDCPADGYHCGTVTKTGRIQLSNCSESRNYFCSRN
ncbi:secretory phospholipase A2 receptor-like [Betta splendens]|uniref:Secretory phospholipase A2 receptor-like n=1 Tax=Betta splendens TaxID=158456 RepID=A0A9W2XP16_BETSP|nr:secretory phospholipase A2 receptor-like [Betta splendens]